MKPMDSSGFEFEPNRLVELLRAAGTERIVDTGETLLYQGDVDQGVRYILSGTADITSFTAEGESLWLGTLGAGHFVGDAAFLFASPVAYEITASRPMNVVFVSRDSFEALSRRTPEIYAAMSRSLAQRYLALADQLVETSSLSVAGRICSELVRLAKPIGIDSKTYVIRPVPMFSRLAERLGVARETVSRTVSNLQKDEVLARTPGAITIENMAALKAAIK